MGNQKTHVPGQARQLLKFNIHGNLIETLLQVWEKQYFNPGKALSSLEKTEITFQCSIYQRNHYFPAILPLSTFCFLRTTKIKKKEEEPEQVKASLWLVTI